VLRATAVFLIVTSLGLAARPSVAQDFSDTIAVDTKAWWVQAAGEEVPEKKFRLFPDDPEVPRDWVGLTRDTALLVGYQLVGAGIIYLLPESISNWSDDDKDISFAKWWDHVQNPQWDQDGWALNYVAHPYFGATYYIRARERGFGRIESFLYSAFASALYEFGVEAIAERPSIQDLIVTPVGGALLGGFVFEPIRSWVKNKPELKWYDHAILIGTDPIGALNYMVESLLGIKSTIRVGIPRGGGAFVELRVPLH